VLPPQGLNGGLQLLQRAYSVDPTHPGVLVMLGHYSLLKGLYDQVGAAAVECAVRARALLHACVELGFFL
jgi:hypothetical protein